MSWCFRMSREHDRIRHSGFRGLVRRFGRSCRARLFFWRRRAAGVPDDGSESGPLVPGPSGQPGLPDRAAGAAAPREEAPAGTGTVHALLRPRGLVKVNGLVETACWRGVEGEPPGRGGTVAVVRAAGGCGWDAWPVGGVPHGDGGEEERPGGRGDG